MMEWSFSESVFAHVCLVVGTESCCAVVDMSCRGMTVICRRLSIRVIDVLRLILNNKTFYLTF